MSNLQSLKANLQQYQNLSGNTTCKEKLEFWIVLIIFAIIFTSLLLLLQKDEVKLTPKYYKMVKTYPYAEPNQLHYYNNEKEVIGWGVNASRDTTAYVYPNRRSEIINPNLEDTEPSFLVIIVTSAPKNYENREIIRKTWGNVEEFNYDYFKILHGNDIRQKYLDISADDWRQYVEVKNYFFLSKSLLFQLNLES
jgi:hypothetical protein